MELDDIDMKIIGILQEDATQTILDISDKVGLTNNPCWRRIRRLEEEGVIQRRVAVIDPAKVGLGMTAFVRIHTNSHTKVWLDSFKKGVSRIPEIVECHRMTGDLDYLLKVLVHDLEHYDEVYRKLIKLVPDLKDVSSAFSMERLNETNAINVATGRR